jgi:hypothetical protein
VVDTTGLIEAINDAATIAITLNAAAEIAGNVVLDGQNATLSMNAGGPLLVTTGGTIYGRAKNVTLSLTSTDVLEVATGGAISGGIAYTTINGAPVAGITGTGGAINLTSTKAMRLDGAIVASILNHPLIEVRLGEEFQRGDDQASHIFYTGAIDRFYDYCFGRLAYRTLDFEVFRSEGDYQGNAVINYCDSSRPFTRITEHKHFAPWESGNFSKTICYREYSREAQPNDTPYYPVNLVAGEDMLPKYMARVRQETKVTFVGRLATYRYLDMDVAIKEALEVARSWIQMQNHSAQGPGA